MEVTAAVSAFFLHGQVTMMLIRTMNESFLVYKENAYVASGIDFLQTNVSCNINIFSSEKGLIKFRGWGKKSQLCLLVQKFVNEGTK